MRIGIYGGTFNPIHNTHIEIAEAAQTQFNLDIVYFLAYFFPLRLGDLHVRIYDYTRNFLTGILKSNTCFRWVYRKTF